MILNNDHIQIWLKTRHFVDALDENDVDLLNHCQEKIIKLFGFKQILYSLIEHLSNQTNLDMMNKLYHELKTCKLQYEANAESFSTGSSMTPIPEDHDLSSFIISENFSFSERIAFDILPTDLLSHICGYLSRNSISNLKLCSTGLAMICLEEMKKMNVGTFNANELLDCEWRQQQSFVNNEFMKQNTLLKYSRYQSLSNVQQHLAKRYDIPEEYQLIIAVDEFTKFPIKIMNDIEEIRPRKIQKILQDRLQLNADDIRHQFLVKWKNEEECTWESRDSLKNLRVWKEYQFRKFEQRYSESSETTEDDDNDDRDDDPGQIADNFVYEVSDEKTEDEYINDYHGCVEFVLFDKRRIILLDPMIDKPSKLSDIDGYSNRDNLELNLKEYKLIFLKYRDANNCNVNFVQFLLIHPSISKKNVEDYIRNDFICTDCTNCIKCFHQIKDTLKETNIISDVCFDQQPKIFINGDIAEFGSIITFQLNRLRLCVKKSI